ncbi:MarR family winged helix-turn-helix transcriptional regulator [Rhizobacter sp. Root1221]|uniref:MarR family winged helix-turn-helix transcriptional regulator n=1 Tax=Rhizobacter sp. Root1221 TaxID=1736433 RepID=UPI000AD3193E|nr:MarR family transcriptional regulator [Rhizobacter sp. Root1221]
MSTAKSVQAKATKKPAALKAKPVPHDLQSDSLGYALRRAQVRAYDVFHSMLGTLDLSPARITALSLIAMEDGINQAALAQRLFITGPSVLKIVDSLEAAHLISRVDCADDRRRYALKVTPAGEEKLTEMRGALQRYEAEIASKLSTQERQQLLQLLDKVATPG